MSVVGKVVKFNGFKATQSVLRIYPVLGGEQAIIFDVLLPNFDNGTLESMGEFDMVSTPLTPFFMCGMTGYWNMKWFLNSDTALGQGSAQIIVRADTPIGAVIYGTNEQNVWTYQVNQVRFYADGGDILYLESGRKYYWNIHPIVNDCRIRNERIVLNVSFIGNQHS